MTQATVKDAAQDESLAQLAGKYLTFLLGEESYGLEILKVQEIIGMQSITRIPRTPDYVKGVINLRGKVIPVIDLRLRFGMESAEVSRKTCIIVVQVTKADVSVTMGIVVDEVSEVLEIAAEEIEPAPGFGTQVETAFILGMAKTESAVKILLDIDKIMSEGEMEALAKSAG
ncbi:MAG: chemotaxis protein CheW [Desulfobacteraceae bacterium]|nr:chemotaxis protein CheW [Desulfobacteraceae bacterium]